MKCCVILPAYNEAGKIAAVIKEVKKQAVDVVVVDDGSEDETSLAAEREGAHVIRHRDRRGKGSSLRNGFDYSVKNNYEILITMDADGQHEASDIPRFIEKNKQTGSSVILGNRMENPKDMPWIRISTNRLMSSIISGICHQQIPDTQCGYRLFTAEAIKSIKIKAHKFEIDSELLIKLAKKGYKIESLPIKSIYAGEISKIRPVRDTLRFIRLLIRILLKG